VSTLPNLSVYLGHLGMLETYRYLSATPEGRVWQPIHAAHGGERETETVFTPESSSPSTIDEGRFPAGTVLAGRRR
jgi:hypothetical protein